MLQLFSLDDFICQMDILDSVSTVYQPFITLAFFDHCLKRALQLQHYKNCYLFPLTDFF